jgi:glycerol-3-phosphate dehydrogenase
VHSRAGYAKIKLGLWTYDRLAQVAADERYRMLDLAETLAIEPTVRGDGLYGAGLYYEYVTDDARLVVEVAKSAAALGAVLVNHAEVVGFLTAGGRVGGVTVRDALSGAELAAAGRVVINAAGPWVDAMRLLAEPQEAPRLHLTKGIHLVLRQERLPVQRIVIMNARDHRGLFAVPRGRVTYLGTTDTNYPRAEHYPAITDADVEYVLETANRAFRVDPLRPEDVVSAWAGLRPLLHEEGKSPSELSRKDEIMVGATGLLSIAGGKLTTFRRMAERIVDLACEHLRAQGHAAPAAGRPRAARLGSGETGDDLSAYAARLKRRWPCVGADIVDHLVTLYGSHAERMVEAMGADPALAERYAAELPLTRAELEYAVREEMAVTLEDFLERRSRVLLWEPDNGLSAAAPVAHSMAELLGWDRQRTAHEIDHYRDLVRHLKAFQVEPAASEPVRARA